ncbi:serine/threonine-protein kinase [Nocardioides coralli]|uniref:serine/threonine-protein kinase n=1 Tax=Nocardioides coralli TaxID=2872154 RepID=UPI001CA39160|nr:serine/threonine-protein kinase [Nocardioides coralli]QZY30316.1 serine/threonine protein kinase [Nocardioides coralli]
MIADRYELEREVGRGGMGAVWLARDEVLGRQVAVKRTGLVPGGGTPDAQRAEREARLAARLSHPNVVAVFDLVADDDGQWLVMEYVDGVTLAALVEREGALPPDRVADLLSQAAAALAAAHAAGITHRDVKPSNILVAKDGQVKLSDFGIARSDAEKTLTATGLVTGSPAYLAPEVASGRSASAASDVWSLGATTFHALAGKPPYEVGDNLLGALYRIVHEEPPRLDDPGWLAPVLEATMTKEPDERWSMEQVHRFLVGGESKAGVVPPATADPQATQVMAATPPPPPRTPDQPFAAVPPEPAPVTSSSTTSTSTSRHGRSTSPLVVAGVAAGLVLLVLLVWLLAGNDDQTPAADDQPDEPASSQTTQSASEPAAEPSADEMEAFMADYLATAPSSPETTFEMLTPRFQRASGGFDGYSGFWGTIESAELAQITADPDALTVAYTVNYVTEDGRSSSDDVVLQLAFRGGDYLIASES